MRSLSPWLRQFGSHSLKRVFLWVLVLVIMGAVAYAAPGNDNFVNAQLLTGANGTVSNNNADATAEIGEPSHETAHTEPASGSVWYRWTAPSSGQYNFDTFGSNFDTVLAIYTGTALNALTDIVRDDDTGVGGQSRVSFTAAVGTQYWIAVDGYSNANRGDVTLNWSMVPSNDNFVNAQLLTGANGTVSGNNASATAEAGEPSHGPFYIEGATGSVWYRWTAPSSGEYTFDASGSDFDVVLAIYTGTSLNALTKLVSDDTGETGEVQVNLVASGGTQYWIAVDGYTNVNRGNITLNWALDGVVPPAAPGIPAAPTYSNIQATSLTVGAPAFPGNTTSLTLQQKLASGADTTYSDIATGLAANSTSSVTGLTASTAYTFRFVAVGAGGTTPGAGANVSTAIAPANSNDNFVNAQLLTGPSGTVSGNNADATAEIGEPSHANNEAATGSLWYRWTAPSSGQCSFDTLGSNFDTVLAVYTGTTLNSLTQIASNDDTIGPDGPSKVSFAATGGTQYWLAVDGYGNNRGNITLNWALDGVVPPAAPGIPAAPTYSNIQATSLTVGAPAFPGNTTSLTLQQKLASGADTTYSDIATGLAANSTSSVTGLTASTAYTFRFVAVGAGGTTPGAGANVSTAIAPANSNDNFVNAQLLTGPSGTVISNNVDATAEADEPSHGPFYIEGASGSVWYRWTAPSSGQYTFDTFGSNFDTVLAIYTGTALNSLTKLVSNDDADGGGQSQVSLTATSGTQYWIAVDGYTNVNRGNITLNWALDGVVPPSAPGVPSFSAISASEITVTAPAFPANTTSLMLQKKLASGADSTYADVATGLAANSMSNVTGLAASTAYTFRFVAVGAGGTTAGSGANVSTAANITIPGVPAAPIFLNVSATTLKVKAPTLPANTVHLQLQKKLSSESDSAYREVIDGLAALSETLVSELSPLTNYTFRFVAMGQNNGATAGVSAAVTTLGALPYQPGVPQFGAVTSTTVQVYAPSLPIGATSLSLFKKLETAPNSSFSVVASGVTGGASVSATGLVGETKYTFYFAAINANGSTPGSSTNLRTPGFFGGPVNPPAAPPTLVIASVGDTTIGFQAVAPPPTDTTFTVQRKYASEPDWAYRDQSVAPTFVIGITPATAYTFRLIARSSDGQTPGSATSATTTGDSLVTPAAPRFSNVAPQSVVVLAPPLPTGANSLTLQKSSDGNNFVDVSTGLVGESSTPVAGLTANSYYYFRFVAVLPSRSVVGTSDGFYTPSSTIAAPTIPVLVAVFPDRIQIKNVNNRDLYYKKSGQSDYQYQPYGSIRWSNQGLVVEFYDLIPNTSYNFRWRAANYDVFGPTLSVITTSATEPLPGLPPAPSIGTVNSGSIGINIPSLPVQTLYLELQYRKGNTGAFITEEQGDYRLLGSGPREFFASSTPYNFTPEPGQLYAFRWVAVGAGGRTVGPETSLTVPLGPDKPGLPIVVGSTNSTVTLTLPPLPPGATSLRLQRATPYNLSPTLVSVGGSTTFAGGVTVTATGLQSGTEYVFGCIAVGDSQTVGDWVNVWTRPNANAPAIPGIPTFSNVQSTQITVTLPPLPAGANSLTLQKKDGNDSSGFWSGNNYRTGLAGNSVINVTGLTPALSYRFRVLAVNAQGETPGSVVAVITDLPLPGLPSFSEVTSGSVKVKAPALPSGAVVMSLHAKVSGQNDSTYDLVSDRLYGGETTQVTGLNRNTNYTFRYIAYSEYRTVLGPEASVITLNASDVWSSGTPISCGGIAWPQNGATLARGSEGLLTAFLATDWDTRSSGATSNTLFSDTCSYLWTASAGQFKYGVASGQQVTWIAPNVPGSYVLTLTVTDQSSANIGVAEIGSRHLGSGAADSPLTFNVTVTVP